MKLYTYDSGKQKRVFAGTYDPTTKIFSKVANPNHYMLKEQGYGIQEDVIQKLHGLGCESVWIITITGDAKQNQSKFTDWLTKQPKDYGNGLQRFMALKDMLIPDISQTTLFDYD